MSTLDNSTEDRYWNPDSFDPRVRAHLLPGLGVVDKPSWWEKVTDWLCKERHIFKASRCICGHFGGLALPDCPEHGWMVDTAGRPRLLDWNSMLTNQPAPHPLAGSFEWEFNDSIQRRQALALRAYQSGSISVDELRRTFALDGRPNEGNVREIIRETEERRYRERERERLMMQPLNVPAGRPMFSERELAQAMMPIRPLAVARSDSPRNDRLDALAMGVYMTESAAAVAQALDAQHTRELQEVNAEVQVEQAEQAVSPDVSPTPEELALNAEAEAAACEAYDVLLEGG
jgi:hypothetical protein